MSAKRYSEELKIEVVNQVTERGCRVADVCRRQGLASGDLHQWVRVYGDSEGQHQQINDQQDELRQLRVDLRRVTEEREM